MNPRPSVPGQLFLSGSVQHEAGTRARALTTPSHPGSSAAPETSEKYKAEVQEPEIQELSKILHPIQGEPSFFPHWGEHAYNPAAGVTQLQNSQNQRQDAREFFLCVCYLEQVGSMGWVAHLSKPNVLLRQMPCTDKQKT